MRYRLSLCNSEKIRTISALLSRIGTQRDFSSRNSRPISSNRYAQEGFPGLRSNAMKANRNGSSLSGVME